MQENNCKPQFFWTFEEKKFKQIFSSIALCNMIDNCQLAIMHLSGYFKPSLNLYMYACLWNINYRIYLHISRTRV